VLGRVREKMPKDALLVVMSDHGFAPYHRKFALNTWLHEKGYLVLKEGHTKELPRNDPGFQQVEIGVPAPGIEGVVDWTKTRAYGMGFNGLYLNLKGREQDDPATASDESGIVKPGAEADALLRELKRELEAVIDPKNGERVVLRCDLASEVYRGSRVAEAPDLIVGFASGYDNSDPASLGRIPNQVLEDNRGGTFNGSHLMAPEVVPGCLMTNGAVEGTGHRLEDVTVEILRRYGIARPQHMTGRPVLK
jgi:predicted AlkP superfamily phosphohydrolase/phosphomutase